MVTDVLFLNPVRKDVYIPAFPLIAGRRNKKISLVLDLNVIARMESCVFEKRTLEEECLLSLVKTLLGRDVYVTPGFAFGEVHPSYSSRAREGYQEFMRRHLPEFVDAPDTTHSPDKDRDNSRLFSGAIDTKKFSISKTYISILLLFLVDRDGAPNPFDKFALFLDRMTVCTGAIGGVESLIAQFAFFDRSKISDPMWATFCGEIRDNFIKPNGRPKQFFINAYNIAHDLYLLRSSSVMHGWPIDGTVVDYWVATADEGLGNLGSSFYFAEDEAGKSSGDLYTTDYVDDQTRNDPFWLQTRAYLESFQSNRWRSGKITERSSEELETTIDELEAEVRAYLAKNPRAPGT